MVPSRKSEKGFKEEVLTNNQVDPKLEGAYRGPKLRSSTRL